MNCFVLLCSLALDRTVERFSAKMTETEFPSFPKDSPLEEYRRRANFNWKGFSLKFFGVAELNYQNEIWKVMEEEPIFKRLKGDVTLAGKFFLRSFPNKQ